MRSPWGKHRQGNFEQCPSLCLIPSQNSAKGSPLDKLKSLGPRKLQSYVKQPADPGSVVCLPGCPIGTWHTSGPKRASLPFQPLGWCFSNHGPRTTYICINTWSLVCASWAQISEGGFMLQHHFCGVRLARLHFSPRILAFSVHCPSPT